MNFEEYYNHHTFHRDGIKLKHTLHGCYIELDKNEK